MSEQNEQEDRMNSKGIDFVFYTVTDFTASVSFYRDTLGLELELLDEEMGWAEFAAPPTTLAIGEASPQMPITPGGGGTGIALAVDDIETDTEKVRNEGGTVRMEPVESGVCQMSMIADPDDNPIILHKRDDGTHGRIDPFL